MTRTDIHRPGSPAFDPQAYELLGVWDNDPIDGNAHEAFPVIQGLLAAGHHAGVYGRTQCGHCGNAIRYCALLLHQAAGEWIWVGSDCLDNRFEDLTAAQFHALRKAAALNRERAAKGERVAALIEAHPLLAWLTYPQALGGGFLADLGHRLTTSGELSERQIEVAERVIVESTAKNDARLARAAAREAAAAVALAAGARVPTGRTEVHGEVVNVQMRESAYGITWKMIVRNAAGWAVWTTVPAALTCQVDTPADLTGAQVAFTATVEQAGEDPLFGFAARPTKARLVAPAAELVAA